MPIEEIVQQLLQPDLVGCHDFCGRYAAKIAPTATQVKQMLGRTPSAREE